MDYYRTTQTSFQPGGGLQKKFNFRLLFALNKLGWSKIWLTLTIPDFIYEIAPSSI